MRQWSRSTLKRSLSKDSLTINALMLLKEFYGNAIKQTRVKYRLSAITASCDRLKKCLTQSCCSANYVTQHVLLKQNNRINLFSTVWSIFKRKKRPYFREERGRLLAELLSQFCQVSDKVVPHSLLFVFVASVANQLTFSAENFFTNTRFLLLKSPRSFVNDETHDVKDF